MEKMDMLKKQYGLAILIRAIETILELGQATCNHWNPENMARALEKKGYFNGPGDMTIADYRKFLECTKAISKLDIRTQMLPYMVSNIKENDLTVADV